MARKRRHNNPVTRWAIYAKRGKTGPKMHFAGGKFTNNGKPSLFPAKELAYQFARRIVESNARILLPYRVTVEAARGIAHAQRAGRAL